MSDPETLCDTVEPLLSDYADGELVSSRDKARIEAHLKTCSRCASDLAFLQATNFVISKSLPDVHPPADLFSRTARATYARPTLRERIALWLPPVPIRVGLGSALAAAVVIAVVVPIVQSPRGEIARDAMVSEAVLHATRNAKNNLDATASGHGIALETGVATPARTVSARPIAASVATATHPALVSRDVPTAYRPVAAMPMSATAPPRHASNHAAEVAMVPSPHTPHEPITPLRPHDLPTLSEKIKQAATLLPESPHEPKLASRNGNFPRTLSNGDLPKEFVAPNPVASDSAPAAAHIAFAAPHMPIDAAGSESESSAHAVVEPPVVPRPFRATLAGAGTGPTGTIAKILANSDHNSGDPQNGLLAIVKSDIH